MAIPAVQVVRVRLTPPLFLRLHVLRMMQKELAYELNITNQRLSQFELHGHIPEKHQAKYQELARQRGCEIPAEWFRLLPIPEAPRLVLVKTQI